MLLLHWFARHYWNVKKWGDWSGRFSETNPQNHDFKTWNSAAKEQEKAGNTVKWRKKDDKYEKNEREERRGIRL